ncbi:D-alanine--poly(phosphoribitol) ligase subunit DltA [Collinsella sp. AGMB00827]|uniref:D-alanine--poly(Phosphoribitol) ligase subunit DltA n=1 Tax=Collinsella ureilytica TaxID=2869515 RepID=A0ABS7MLB4_9ACTN|nr:D-alanine--poly(phosphoribitol) ligase subunit DltA [Collinsella urealyticum]MBY4798151.1 D-alanine--poly(phosphoribitol) ligase subunit DltA [Collinsella urealyticum]
MHLLDLICARATDAPEACVHRGPAGEEMSYGELWARSGSLAAWLQAEDRTGDPVMAYGHKSSSMLVSFVACMRAGRPYVPIDLYSVPHGRTAAIAAQLGMPTVLACTPFPHSARKSVGTVADAQMIEELASSGQTPDPQLAIAGEDLCYILFTSGSTGAPKGVEVTAQCVDNFAAWDIELADAKGTPPTYLDQPPFSFDLSVFELAGALAQGGTLVSIDHETQADMARLMAALAASEIDIWVSTPSFADFCLSAEEFSDTLLPKLKLFLFCGETLPRRTVLRLQERFGSARIVNTYGPTESTVAVSAVEITEEMASLDKPLPVGLPRAGTRLRIVDEDGNDLDAGTCGEVIIEGDTVARGYRGRPDVTRRSFGVALMDGKQVRTYRTGDEGFLDEAGMLHYRGRLDLQVKLNGFRIELGEIEEALRRLSGVDAAAVVAPMREGKVSHLVAHVVYTGDRVPNESDFRLGLRLKEALKASLPHYMIPRRIVICPALPMTGNGKVDRRALLEAAR